MESPLKSLISSGTKLWIDSIDPALVAKNRKLGATGATSNPIIVADLLKSGDWHPQMKKFASQGQSAEQIAWSMTNFLVEEAEKVFLPVYEKTKGDDGFVSFELDPLIEDGEQSSSHNDKVKQYVELGNKWSLDHPNRMIKVPATPAGIDALEELAAAGIKINVTLIFSESQYQNARNAVWRGAQRRKNLDSFKSVYSIFVSRLDVYSEKYAKNLGSAQGYLGILNAKRIWKQNEEFWKSKNLKLSQEMIFASTGTKNPEDPAWKYVAALAGSDIETNPPTTNDAVEASGIEITSQIRQLPEPHIIDAIDAKVDFAHMEATLMAEGLAKFAAPQKALLKIVTDLIS